MNPQDKKQFAAECNRRRDEGLVLIGKTFSIKESIKEAGGIWDGNTKGWLIPDRETLNRFETQLGLPISDGSVENPTVEPTIGVGEAIVANGVDAALVKAEQDAWYAERGVEGIGNPPTESQDKDGRIVTLALEEAEMVIEARETELADIRFRMETLATALSSATSENALDLCQIASRALLKVAFPKDSNG